MNPTRFLISAAMAVCLVSCGSSSSDVAALTDKYHTCLGQTEDALPFDAKSGFLFSGFREGHAEMSNGTLVTGRMNISLSGRQELIVAGEGGQESTRYPVDNVQTATVGGMEMKTLPDMVYGDFFLIPVASSSNNVLLLRVMGRDVVGSPSETVYETKMYLSRMGKIAPASVSELEKCFRDKKQFIEAISAELDVNSCRQMKALFSALGE